MGNSNKPNRTTNNWKNNGLHATYPNLNKAKMANLHTNGELLAKPLRTQVEENGKNMGGKHEYKQEEMKSCIRTSKMEEDRREIFCKIKMGKGGF